MSRAAATARGFGLGLPTDGIVGQAIATAWGGYSGYFQDPDGQPWEVAWNPAWEQPD